MLCEELTGGLGWFPTRSGSPPFLAGSRGDTEAQHPDRAASLSIEAFFEVETPPMSHGVAAPRARAASEPELELVPASNNTHNSPGGGAEDLSGLWLLCETALQMMKEEEERASKEGTLGDQQQPENPPLRRSQRRIKRRVL